MKIQLKDVEHFYNKGSHGLDHIKRVLNNSLIIAETIDCDIEVVKASALLHDIARGLNSSECHANKGAEMALEFLKDFDYSVEQVNNIIHCIRVHRFSKGLKPETVEAGILQDADRLDSLGAMVISRIFYSAGERGIVMHDPSIKPKEYVSDVEMSTAINHIFEKILKIKPSNFNTIKGRELAVERYDFVKNFLKQFLKEWG